MSFKKFLTSRIFILNLLLAVVLVFLLLFITMGRLKKYTHHNDSYSVPQFAGLTLEEAEVQAEKGLVRVQIVDSVYSKFDEPGTIVDQVPKAGKKVKEGRLIYLTVNAMEPEKIKLPRLTDISFRQAQVLLDNNGLTIDSITYEPSEYNDLVLRVIQNSEEVKEGDELVKGSSVVLVIGQQRGNMETSLPDLKGLFIEQAGELLTNSRLNLGVIIYDSSIKTATDSLNARVWRQMPDPVSRRTVQLGSPVDLWLSVDPEKFNTESLPEQN